jgi:hypothetical protein
MKFCKVVVTINKKKFEFSGMGMFISLIYLVMSFVLFHGYLLGEPFESFMSILVTIYLITCTWAFPYIIKEVERFDDKIERIGYTIFKGLSVIAYIFAPFIYLYLKYFDEESEEDSEKENQSKKIEFSRLGFIISCFYFFFIFVILHTAWLGNSFESLLSIFVFIYLSACTWAFSYTYKALDAIIENILKSPLGYILLMVVQLVLYLFSPIIFIRFKYFDKEIK